MPSNYFIHNQYQKVPKTDRYSDLSERSSLSTANGDELASEKGHDVGVEGLVQPFLKTPCKQKLITLPRTLMGVIFLLCVVVLVEIRVVTRMRKDLVDRVPRYSRRKSLPTKTSTVTRHKRFPNPIIPVGLTTARNTERHSEWPNRFFSDDVVLNEESWGKLNTGHGVVSFSPEEAEALNMPKSHPHFLDSSKMLYNIEAYHLLHCTVRYSVWSLP